MSLGQAAMSGGKVTSDKSRSSFSADSESYMFSSHTSSWSIDIATLGPMDEPGIPRRWSLRDSRLET